MCVLPLQMVTMTTRSLRLALLLAVIALTSASCPSSEWKEYRDMCYRMSDDGLSWEDAKKSCPVTYPGSELASIHDEDQNAFITEHLYSYAVWIGLSRSNKSSDWIWTDGSAYNYSKWIPSTELFCRGNCALFNIFGSSLWCGDNCSQDHEYYLCQIAAS